MTSRLKPTSSQLSSNLSRTQSNQEPQVSDPTFGVSLQDLRERVEAARHATSGLLKDTKWPTESNDAAQNLLQTITTNVPDLPDDLIPFHDTAEQFIRALEAAHLSVKKASEKYGERERGFRDGLKYQISSLRSGKCTEILSACRGNVEKVSATLRNRLGSVEEPGRLGGEVVPSSLQSHLTKSSVQDDRDLESPPSPKAKSEEQFIGTGHPADPPPSTQNPSSELLADEEDRHPIRDGALVVAKQTFKAVETVSGAIPGIGDFVGVTAKVGLAFVDMIETMDQNEDVARELTSHTSKLSRYLEYFKTKSTMDDGDDFVAQIDNLHKELEYIQKKVGLWNSSGRLKKAFLASEHAEKMKSYQEAVQNTLEEMQARHTSFSLLLVSLKTADVVIELKNSEVRAERRRLLDRLGDGSYGARGNSIEDVVCCPGTRVGILDRINEWIKDASSTERVLWIRGMAGRGKSAIASTVAHTWASKGSCALFHFRRGQNALDGQFICALARQLGKGLVPEVKKAILDCVRENEDIARERLDRQFKTLLVGSLGKIRDHAHPIIIVVDALDECSNVTDAVRFVRLIDQHCSFIPTNVKFLLTCRPEAPLLVALEPRKWHVEDLDSIPDMSGDITRFVLHACKQIRDDHGLPETWPSPVELKGIVGMSQGLFQWARTAVSYVGNKSPADRLQDLLQRSSTWSGLDDLYHQILSKAFKEVDSDHMRRELLSSVLGILVVAPNPVSLDVIAFLYADHKIFVGRENIIQFLRNDILADLNSLLHIPASQSEPVRLMHTSIRDLLTAQERCKSHVYFVNITETHRRLAGISLQIMRRDLRQNICNLFDISKANSEVQNEVERHIPQGLQYCCRSWPAHLTAGVMWSETKIEATSTVFSDFKLVSDEKLLFWLEVMSLIRATVEASTAAKQVRQWLLHGPQEMSTSDLNTLWNDTQRFIAAFFDPISFGALHIYASALPFCPVGTALWTKYRSQATTRVLLGSQESNWPAAIWTSWTNSPTKAIAFSHDGNSLASGSDDAKVRLWDAQTGAQLGDPLNGHQKSITSVAFSPHGKILASGSQDMTIRLWDTHTGASLGDPLTGHRDWIKALVFSPDGQILASGSSDKTIRLWDAQTRAPLGDPLTGHSRPITSVVFSADGKTIASGSFDKTVRLWDAQSRAPLASPLNDYDYWIRSVVFLPDGKVLASGSEGTKIQLLDAQSGALLGDPLTDHQNYIRSVVFSPDGKVLASGSDDRTVRLWDAQTGAPLGDPLTGHRDRITSLVFSPDSSVLASGSVDNSVRLWDVHTGALLGGPLTGQSSAITSDISLDGKSLAPGSIDETVQLWDAQAKAPLSSHLTGHSDRITSVAFSPDGSVLASGSVDETVRLWNVHTGAPLLGSPLLGHSSSITSVVFSPDGKFLASGSLDETVRLWDAQTGAPLGDPLIGHRNWIRSVVFSRDGKVLASGSQDHTIQLWDVQTGVLLGDPLTGHTDSIRSVVFSPDGNVLASGSDDKTVRLWDAQTGAALGDPITGHSGSIKSIAFSPDGKVLASGSDDKTVRLWDAAVGAPLGNPLTGHGNSITAVLFSPDGNVLASGSDDGSVQLWNPLTCQIWNVLPSSFTPRHLGLRSNWVVCDSRRLMWLPAPYQQGSPHVNASFGKLALWSSGVFSIFDAPHYLKF